LRGSTKSQLEASRRPTIIEREFSGATAGAGAGTRGRFPAIELPAGRRLSWEGRYVSGSGPRDGESRACAALPAERGLLRLPSLLFLLLPPPLPPAQLPAGPFPFSSFSSMSAHSGAPNSSPPPRRWRSRVFRSRSRESPTPLCAAACGLTSMAFFARLSGRGGNSFFRD
jgi:hypothetical protein